MKQRRWLMALIGVLCVVPALAQIAQPSSLFHGHLLSLTGIPSLTSRLGSRVGATNFVLSRARTQPIRSFYIIPFLVTRGVLKAVAFWGQLQANCNTQCRSLSCNCHGSNEP